MIMVSCKLTMSRAGSLRRKPTVGAVLRGLLAFALVLVAAAFFAGAVLVVLLGLVTFFSVVLAFSDFSVTGPGFLSLTGPDLPAWCQSRFVYRCCT